MTLASRTRPRWLVAFDAAMVVLACAGIALGFYQWHVVGAPDWTPVSVLGLISVPILLRYSVTVSTDRFATVIGLPVVVLFASDFGSGGHIFPVWALLVMASYVLFKGGPVRGLLRAADDVVGGWTLVALAPHVDFGLVPFDRTAVGLAAFLLTIAVVFWVRRLLSGQESPARSLALRSAGLALLALYYASVFVACLRRSYTDPSATSTAEVAVLGIGLLVAAMLTITVSQRLGSGVAVLSEAATSLPWPADDNDRLLLRFAQRAVTSDSAELQPEEGPPGSLSVPVDAFRHVVLRRVRSERRFSSPERRLLEAVVSMAQVSRSVDLREAGLRLRSITDALTGLWTYSMFEELMGEVEGERSDDETLAVLFLEIDDFQRINEELGHFDADELLRQVASRLQEAAPPTAIAARAAGVSFALLLRGAEPATIDADVQLIVDAVTSPVEVSGRLQSVHATMGVAVTRSRNQPLDDVLRAAETNMRSAKIDGRATVAAPEDALVTEARGDDDTVLFQPILDARSGALWGCELVVPGGNDDEAGLSRVSSAARQRVFDALTRVVGDDALAAIGALRERVSAPLALTVDLPLEQFRPDHLVLDDLARRLDDAGASLVLELSERRYRHWTDQHDQLAQGLKENGVRLAIDDFGAGAATFSLLNKWGWDVVKIDRSLVVADDEQSKLLFTNLVRTMRELKIPAAADGVETGAQLYAARRAGVSLVQGPLVCEPVTLEELLDRVGPAGDALAETLQVGA